MKSTLLKTTLLAIAGAALLATSGQAQVTYANGDFLLGARLAGSTQSVVVDLGPISSFATTQSFSTTNFGSLLSSTFGSNWATNGNVFFSLQANSTTTTPALEWVTSPETPPGGPEAVAWNGPNTVSQNNAFRGQILEMGVGYNNFTSQQTVSNHAVVEAASDANAYAQFMPGGSTDVGHAGSGNVSYGRFNPTIEGNFANGVSGITLDLIQLTSGGAAGTDVGDFQINGDGSIVTFVPDSIDTVPEPSTYAAAALSVVGLLLLNRRRVSRLSQN